MDSLTGDKLGIPDYKPTLFVKRRKWRKLRIPNFYQIFLTIGKLKITPKIIEITLKSCICTPKNEKNDQEISWLGIFRLPHFSLLQRKIIPGSKGTPDRSIPDPRSPGSIPSHSGTEEQLHPHLVQRHRIFIHSAQCTVHCRCECIEYICFATTAV